MNNNINPKQPSYAHTMMKLRSEKIQSVVESKSGGWSLAATGEVGVPSEETAYGRTIRMHEATHQENTKEHRALDLLDQALEDARIHRYHMGTRSMLYSMGIKSPRQDELEVAVSDMQKVIDGPMITPVESLVTLRGIAITLGEFRHDADGKDNDTLTKRAARKIGKLFLRHATEAIDMLAMSDGIDTPEWDKARKLLAPYFRQSFAGEIKIDPIGPVGQPGKDKSKQPKPEPREEGDNRDTATEEGENGTDDTENDSEDNDSEGSQSDDSESDEESTGADDDSEAAGDSDDSSNEDEESIDEEQDGNSADENGESGTHDESSDESGNDEAGAEDGPDEPHKQTQAGVGMPEEKMAGVIPPDKYAPAKVDPDEYTADLAPAWDAKNFAALQAALPIPFYVRRLDTGVNSVRTIDGRVNLRMGYNGTRLVTHRLAQLHINPLTKVFSKNNATGGAGSIVIDASGSMSLTDEMLKGFLASAPMLTLGFYNGGVESLRNGRGGYDYQYFGNLFIYAANGRRAKELNISTELSYGIIAGEKKGERAKYHGGNVVDYHAIAWLLRQPEPRYLVTDRAFCSGHDVAAHMLLQYAESSGLIRVVPTIADMQRILDRR